MLRSRILAAATATALLLGMGVGGATAASASEFDAAATGPVVTTKGLSTKGVSAELLPAGLPDPMVTNWPTPEAVAPTMVYQSLAYYYKKDDPSAVASFANSGLQTLLLAEPNKRDFLNPLTLQLPAGVCGSGWGIQLDVIRYAEGTFTIPKEIPRQTTPFSKAGVLVKAMHVDVAACPPPVPPTVTQCVTPNPMTEITSLEGMYFATLSGGSQNLGENGIEIATFGDDLTQAKSAGYVGLVPPIPFGEIGTPSMDYSVTSGASAGLNVTLTKNGVWFGNLVFEPLFDQWWINKAVPGMPAGPNPGYQLAYGSLDQFYAAFVKAGWTVNAVAVGYSLGSNAIGTGIVRSLSIGCDTYTFGLTPFNPPTLGTIPAAASSVAMTCDVRGGSYTFGATGPDAGKLNWTVNGQPATPPSEPVAVSTTTTIVVTARVAPEFAAAFGINPSGNPEVNQQTGVYTWTFVFTVPTAEQCDDRELIPVVDPFEYVDSCLLGQSYSLIYVRGITYWVTVDPAGPQGPGEPFQVVFEPNQTKKTFIPNPGDFVSAMPVADEGFVLAPNQPKPLSHTFAVYGPNGCQLEILPNWPASVTATNQVCTPTGMSAGSITVGFSTGSVSNPNPVRYFLAYGTPEQRELTSATTSMPAGSYVVTAVVTDPKDSINNAGQSARFAVTVGAPTVSTCDLDTLAFTGTSQSVGWLGALAVLMTVAGVGFVLRRHRIEV